MNKEQRTQHWQKSGGARPLRQYDSFQDAFSNKPHGEDGLNIGPVDIACIDEGIKPRTDTVRMAGSGILLNPRQIDQIKIKATPIKKVLYHEECGAAGLYKEGQHLTARTDEVAAREAQRIATVFGTEYLQTPVTLHRPAGLHVARAVFYDGTRTGYEASQISPLPTGFGISRGVFGQEIGHHDASLAIQIATGPSGFGENFTPATPLHLVSMYDGRDRKTDPEQLKEEMELIRAGRNDIAISSIDIAKRKPTKTIVELKS